MGQNCSSRATTLGWELLNASGYPSLSWEVVQWGDVVYATNGINPLQKIKILDGGDFEQLDVPNGLSGRFMCYVAGFLMIADVREFMANTRYPYQCRWSGFQRPERWELDASIQADLQEVADIGQFRGLTGGEFALLLGDNGFARADYVGPDIIFKFTTIETNVGCEIPQSVVRTGNMTFWWSQRGWRMSTGEVSTPIGLGQVDDWFRRTINNDPAFQSRMSTQVLYDQSIVMWSFMSVFSAGEPDYVLAYNWITKAWTMGRFEIQILGNSIASSATTDDSNIPLPGYQPTSTTDDFQQLTDDFTGDEPFLAAMLGNSLAVMSQNGTITSEIEIKETQFNPDGLSTLNKMIPIVHSADVVVMQIRSRDRQDKEVYRVYNNIKPEVSGIYSCRSKGRYHRVKLFLGGPFKKALGIDFTEIFKAGNR
jgi:hypothetical protein